MFRFSAVTLVFAVATLPAVGQQKKMLETNGFGSLSGKVTLVGKIPDVIDLVPKMKLHVDKDCCLAGKPNEKIDQTWMVDPKSKGIANVVIWVKAPNDTYFPIPDKLKNRKDKVVIDQPHCAYVPRVSAANLEYFDGTKYVFTGQTLLFKNSAVSPHNVMAVGHVSKNPGFNRQIAPKTEFDAIKDFKPGEHLKPQLLPINLQCNAHTWMSAKLFMFDHPYYAITKADGTFEIPMVPAGAEISVMSWHEGIGWAFKEGKAGRPITIENGKKHTLDFELKAPVGD